MKRIWMSRTLILAMVLGLLLCGSAVAQSDEGADATSAELKAELAAVKAELKAIRGDLRKVLTELAAVKAAQGKARPAQRKPDTTVYNIDLGDSPIRGPKDAPVTIVEYASFACGWCIKEYPTLQKVMAAYPNDVRWVFKHYPMWDRAKPSHAAAALAHQQKGNDGFWQMHDKISEGGTKKLDTPSLRGYAESMGMDLAEFDEVMADTAKLGVLAMKDTPTAKNYKVTGTPAVFINGLRLGPRGLDNYKARIDAILKEKGKAKGG
ncbi:MAG: DsbA family protein [Planctomycetota bacterium]|jgi:protein-disulfide isomerase